MGSERDIIRHSLGLSDGHNTEKPYRLHFAAVSGTDDYATCEALVEKGHMRKGPSLGYGHYFYVTEAGAKSVGSELPTNA